MPSGKNELEHEYQNFTDQLFSDFSFFFLGRLSITIRAVVNPMRMQTTQRNKLAGSPRGVLSIIIAI